MKNKVGIILGSAALILTTGMAQADITKQSRSRIANSDLGSSLQIDMYGSHLRGQNIIPLKQKIKEAYPGINLQSAKLKSVVLVAKTKKGQGTAVLKVGGDETYPQSVYGHVNDFHDNHRRTFTRVKLQNPSYNSQGAWKVKLKGNFKVQKIRVNIEQVQQRTRKLVMKLDNQYYSGLSQIGIKRLIRKHHGNQVLRNKVIKKVTLVAKSKKGRASAALSVGGQYSHEHRIPGKKFAFYIDSPYTYHNITLQSPTLRSSGAVKVHLDGKVKIDKIIVKLGRGRY